MDAETRVLADMLRERDRLQRDLAANGAVLKLALDAWTATRPGHVRGKTTEAGARFILGQIGVL